MKRKWNISLFGSSVVSAFWNGAATYYRGMLTALHARGHQLTFYEPDAYGRQQHRDIINPIWADVIVYSSNEENDLFQALDRAQHSDLIIKCSGVGVFDDLLEHEISRLSSETRYVAFWDVDAAATLERIHINESDSFRPLIPAFDLILTYGGGDRVVEGYRALGARRCIPIYNALDSSTHYPVVADPRFTADLTFIGNRLPDREARVHEFFLNPAKMCSSNTFVLGGNGWGDHSLPSNVKYCGHIYTKDHNVINSSARAVLNINRESMTAYGYSPPTRVFEAAGAAACIITDAWKGIDMFLEPEREVLIAQNGREVLEHLEGLTIARARLIGEAARRRILSEHTYQHRAQQLEAILDSLD
jgi:spore maturation protein CgeB